MRPVYLPGDANSPSVERPHGDLEPHALLPEHVRLGHPAALHDEVGGRRGPYAQLVFFLAERHTRRIQRDNKRAYPSGIAHGDGERHATVWGETLTLLDVPHPRAL